MSEFNYSDYIHIPDETEYLSSLKMHQRLAYMSFYLSLVHPNYSEREASLRELWNDRPIAHNQLLQYDRYKTIDNTLIVVSSTSSADNNPDEHLVVIGELRDDTMHIDELEILGIKQVVTRPGEFHKVIDAKWNETSKIVSLRLGGRALMLEQDQNGAIRHTPLEGISPIK